MAALTAVPSRRGLPTRRGKQGQSAPISANQGQSGPIKALVPSARRQAFVHRPAVRVPPLTADGR